MRIGQPYQTVWKYPLIVQDVQIIEVPEDAWALTVQMQRGTPCLWVLVDPAKKKSSRKVLIAGTGHMRDDLEGSLYIGSFQMADDELIFHVFDGGPA